MLPPPSTEQTNVINGLTNNNIVVDSIAGAGKTTTVLHIANAYPNKKILLLTYNSKLRHETRTRIQSTTIYNIDVHTYHSFCYQFNKKSSTDMGIRLLLDSNDYKLDVMYDIIIVDEAQDITPLYYQVIHSIFSKYTVNEKNKMKLCVLGDERQNIYEFNNADSRFITMANDIYNINRHPWKPCNLSTTYRLNKKMVDFVNDCVLNAKTLIHSPTNPSTEDIDYYLVSSYESEIIYNNIIKDCIERYGESDVLIIAPSVRDKTPFKKLINHMCLKTKYATYISSNDEAIVDRNVLEGKLVFLTYHQAKGLERECVIVYGVDHSYNVFYNRNKTPAELEKCPNAIYVALTRAKQKLIMLHDYSHEFLRFLNTSRLVNYTKIYCLFRYGNQSEKPVYKHIYCNDIDGLGLSFDIERSNVDIPKKDELIKRLKVLKGADLTITEGTDIERIGYGVTEFIRHLPSDVINQIYTNYIVKDELIIPGEIIQVKQKVPLKYSGKLIYEEVSSINGTFVPFYYEYHTLKRGNNCGIIKSLTSPYCVKKYIQQYDMIELLIKDQLYGTIINTCETVKDTSYINYFHVCKISKNDDKEDDKQLIITHVSYKKGEQKQKIRIGIKDQCIKVIKFDPSSRKDINVKSTKHPELENMTKVEHCKVFFTYFDYLYYKGGNIFDVNINKLDYIDLRNKINSCAPLSKSDLLKLTNIYDSSQNYFLNKLVQLKDNKYDWFSDKDLVECMNRLDNELNTCCSKLRRQELEFEKQVAAVIKVNSELVDNGKDINVIKNMILCGAVDCTVHQTVYEFKFVNELLVEHMIQLLLYAFILCNNDPNNIHNDYYLYNIKTGEKLKLDCKPEELKKMVNLIHYNKNNKKCVDNDNKFKETCDTMIRNLYVKIK